MITASIKARVKPPTEVLLPFQSRRRLLQGRFSRLDSRLRRLNLGLLLRGVEPGQHLVGGDMVADITRRSLVLPATRNDTSLRTRAATTPVKVISGAKSVTWAVTTLTRVSGAPAVSCLQAGNKQPPKQGRTTVRAVIRRNISPDGHPIS